MRPYGGVPLHRVSESYWRYAKWARPLNTASRRETKLDVGLNAPSVNMVCIHLVCKSPEKDVSLFNEEPFEMHTRIHLILMLMINTGINLPVVSHGLHLYEILHCSKKCWEEETDGCQRLIAISIGVECVPTSSASRSKNTRIQPIPPKEYGASPHDLKCTWFELFNDKQQSYYLTRRMESKILSLAKGSCEYNEEREHNTESD